ncbi:unnamed protein product, partial [Gordionus sp. m RMFG-2023]
IFGFNKLYKWQREIRINAKVFSLHDGPPYANGVPHLGHAVNKILKDIINRFHMLRGDKIHYQPGWDCHGLPIEMKAVNNYGKHKVSNLRRLCKEYALAAIEKQKEAFQIWGVMANWKDCYYTFNNHYESNEILNFFNLFTKVIN